ncbi:MAG TPA: DNA gyrase inhibitor YacG [Deltaproteobacteria bacterium]|nr:DNA gyrase inhibitor YacG [Deltaproteobacteria bacterium]HPJ95002.1 DNA gyrase inhibitor YacG [Deltaproteobacteria bacterium]HPR51756.1 DNA gyrase inhibitor YacG [Deltaproteobacteria bacterium]
MNAQKPRMVRCPSCGKEVPFEDNPFRPFCSRGCKGLDLIHWTDESYRISKNEHEDDEDRENGE